MLRGNEPGIDDDLAGLDVVVVKAFAEFGAAQLADFQTAPLDPEVTLQALQHHHAMGDALELEIIPFGGPVVEEKHSAFPSSEVTLEPKDLPTITQGIAGQHAQLGEGVEDHALRREGVHLLQYG
jgi:hypothetical protein